VEANRHVKCTVNTSTLRATFFYFFIILYVEDHKRGVKIVRYLANLTWPRHVKITHKIYLPNFFCVHCAQHTCCYIT